jgi:2-dehydro-3-deoxygluconokinase
MTKSERLFERLKDNRLIALLTPKSPAQSLRLFKTLDPMGVTLEIAFRGESAGESLRAIRTEYPQALLLAGTVMTRAQADEAIASGAAGIVSADFIPEVVDACVRAGVMCVPGGLADAGKQLVQKAEGYGCSLTALREKHPYQWIYKLFPAVAGGTSNAGLAEAWRGPFKDLAVVYAGGVNIGNLAALAGADPRGIFCSSALTANSEDAAALETEARRWIDILRGGERNEARSASIPPPASAPSEVGPRPRVVTFGEIMLRLSPPNFRRFVQATSYEATFGGAEANAAVALACFGLPSVFVTAVPKHEIGQAAIDLLRSRGVDTSRILRRGRRLGLYFVEAGASQRPSKVIYDREGSAMAELKPGSFDWTEIFNGAAWFHWSGITPALSDDAAAATAEAVRAAKKAGATVSVDLNYRAKLWTAEKARTVMTPLMEFVDIAFGNEEDASDIFGLAAPGSRAADGRLDLDGYRWVAEEMRRRFPLRTVGLTLRESRSASINLWSGCLSSGTDFWRSRVYEIHLVDRIGGGDAFSSGYIFALLTGKSEREALEFAAAASCLKQTIPGDFNLVSREEVERLAAGSGAGRIQR